MYIFSLTKTYLFVNAPQIRHKTVHVEKSATSPPVFAHFIFKNRIVSYSRSNRSFSGGLTESLKVGVRE